MSVADLGSVLDVSDRRRVELALLLSCIVRDTVYTTQGAGDIPRRHLSPFDQTDHLGGVAQSLVEWARNAKRPIIGYELSHIVFLTLQITCILDFLSLSVTAVSSPMRLRR